MSQAFSFASAQCGSGRHELTEWMRAAQIPPHLSKLLERSLSSLLWVTALLLTAYFSKDGWCGPRMSCLTSSGHILVVISHHWVRKSGCGVQGCVCHLPSRWLCWSLTFESNCSKPGGSAGWVHFLGGIRSCSACVTLQETQFLNEQGPTLWGIDIFPPWVCDSGNQRALLVPAGCHGNLLCKLSLGGEMRSELLGGSNTHRYAPRESAWGRATLVLGEGSFF